LPFFAMAKSNTMRGPCHSRPEPHGIGTTPFSFAGAWATSGSGWYPGEER
jgi:hypothetical protein